MSLRLSISAVEQKSSFIVTDCTGNISVDNKGGFGIPNIRVQDIETSNLTIKTPSGQIFPISVTGDFPNEEHVGYEILPYMVGMQEIESGQYEIKLTITGTEKSGKKFEKSTITKPFFTKSVTCCIDKMISKNIGTEDKLKKSLIVDFNNLLTSMNDAVECNKPSAAIKIIDYLKEQCSCCNCKN